jgi:hypothetical protein
MDETTGLADSTSAGIDRRSALKKVAIGGAVAWTAPMVMSSRVSAQEACTGKCAPVGGVTISATVTIAECDPNEEPGGQPINGVITSITAEPDSCGCGGTPTVTLVTPSLNDVFQIRPNPGNEAADFSVDVTITCLDRQGREVSQSCSVTFTDVGNPGNCEARGGDQEFYSGAASCGPAFCGV